MDSLQVRCAAAGKAVPPRPTKLGSWAGPPRQKMADGSDPQPWHCLPFVEGSTYGLELVYPYEAECQVVNDGGRVRFEWDYAGEPGASLTGGEFMAFAPAAAPKFYLFNTGLDVRPPDGHVVRTEPHPRYFTADEPTVPLAMVGHLQNEWYARTLFVVFRSPRRGERHVFRKGEPYAQLLFPPRRAAYDVVPMPAAEQAERRRREAAVGAAKTRVADHAWRHPDGAEFDNHYKMLSRAFQRDGAAGVDRLVADAQARQAAALPGDRPIAECLADGRRCLAEQRYNDAKAVYGHVLGRDPANAEAMSNLGICAAAMGHVAAAVKLMSQAAANRPDVAAYHGNLGDLFVLLGRPADAEPALRAAGRTDPANPSYASALGHVLARLGRAAEGLPLAERAAAAAPGMPSAHYRLGAVLAALGRTAEARARLEAAVALYPGYEDARRALASLPATLTA